jgi:hypothetical protein
MITAQKLVIFQVLAMVLPIYKTHCFRSLILGDLRRAIAFYIQWSENNIEGSHGAVMRI